MKTKSGLILLLALCAAVGVQAEVAQVSAFCREGQTFLTWQEDGAEWYYVYAADKPLRSTKGLKWIAKIPKGSNRFRFPDALLKKGGGAKKFKDMFKGNWAQRIQIQDDAATAKALADGTGLFVRTVKKDGPVCYAVTSAEGGAAKPGVNALAAPVNEKTGLPGATLQFIDKHLHYFTFFTDFEVWNPDGIDDHPHGYAHVFLAAIPPKVADPAPLCVRLHAYSAWRDVFMKYTWPIRDGVTLAMFDYNLTWWFGLSDQLPKLNGKHPPAGTVVNFTEQRLLQAVRWVISNPKNFPVTLDPQRVYVYGGSMGGSGTNHVSLKNGDLVTSGHASKGYTNWAVPKEFNRFLNDFQGKYGPIDRNDPTNLDGRKVYDVLNLTSWVGDPSLVMPYLETANGSIDGVIPFYGLAAFWDALEKGKHPYSSGWEMVGHASRLGSGSRMVYYRLRRDESLPAMANASCNSYLKFGLRLQGKVKAINTGSVELPAPLKHDVKGMTLVLGPSGVTKKWFRITRVEGAVLHTEGGDLTEYVPPLTKWTMSQLKKKLKREPNPADIKTEADKSKIKYLIIDGDPRGTRNGHITWSCRLQDFDAKSDADNIIDTAEKWGMSFRLAKNGIMGEWSQDTATVDITPRRCQQFKPSPGTAVHWENRNYADPAKPVVLAEGDVKTDTYGLVTVTGFVVGKKGLGNRLVLTVK